MRTQRISLLIVSLMAALSQSVAYAAGPSLPPAWQARWQKPLMEDRPLQIVHEMQPQRATVSGMQYYLERGLGGVVTNVSFHNYMKSEAAWKTLITAVESCEKLGMVVWIYDEKGYPSGAAGTLVLDKNPAFEAAELTYDKNRAESFQVRAAFEHSHAANNYYATRRYPNLIDKAAVECFIDNTHQQYWMRLQRHFGKTIRATFTDEPSLMAVNLGQLPEAVRKKMQVVHQPDPQVPPLPSVPWCDDLPERYKQRFGEDILAARKSLFEGDSQTDKLARRRYWSLISDLIEDRYFGALGRWCESHGIASSGHSLWEESIMFHVPLEGNGLASLGRMHIPGLDMLNSSPDTVIHAGWMTAALPSSAALLHGRRDVMTEVSDFSQKMAGQGPADLARMQATAAWQAAWGVT
ncbi:MAG: hypothetical protein JXM70_28265, partial [Pirellulales bacterium]|nr:hypothetical protein [Pirellulales bacterium]